MYYKGKHKNVTYVFADSHLLREKNIEDDKSFVQIGRKKIFSGSSSNLISSLCEQQ